MTGHVHIMTGAAGFIGRCLAKRLLEAGDTVIGFIWPEGNTFDYFIDPRHARHLTEMIAWGEASARAQGAKQIEVIAIDRDEPRRAAGRAQATSL